MSKTMHPVLVSWFRGRLDTMSAMCNAMFVLHASPTQLYEELISDPVLLTIFRKAAAHMKREGLYMRATVTVDGQPLDVLISLSPTQTDRCYLLPEEPWVTRESNLGRALLEQHAAMRGWAELRCVFDKFSEKLPYNVVSFLLPWLRDLALDLQAELDEEDESIGGLQWRWRDKFRNSGENLSRIEAERAQAQLNMIIKRGAPSDFPLLGGGMNAICKSGVMLISQWRMLKAAGHDPERAHDQISVITSSLPLAAENQVAEIVRDWEDTHPVTPRVTKRRVTKTKGEK